MPENEADDFAHLHEGGNAKVSITEQANFEEEPGSPVFMKSMSRLFALKAGEELQEVRRVPVLIKKQTSDVIMPFEDNWDR